MSGAHRVRRSVARVEVNVGSCEGGDLAHKVGVLLAALSVFQLVVTAQTKGETVFLNTDYAVSSLQLQGSICLSFASCHGMWITRRVGMRGHPSSHRTEPHSTRVLCIAPLLPLRHCGLDVSFKQRDRDYNLQPVR